MGLQGCIYVASEEQKCRVVCRVLRSKAHSTRTGLKADCVECRPACEINVPEASNHRPRGVAPGGRTTMSHASLFVSGSAGASGGDGPLDGTLRYGLRERSQAASERFPTWLVVGCLLAIVARQTTMSWMTAAATS